MNLDRLKFAWARGARIQHHGFHDQHDGKQWVDCPVAWVFLPGYTSYRIHPDDAHLEYGPVSSALRDLALYPMQTEWSPYKEMALEYMRQYALVFIDPRQSYSAETWGTCILFLAEYLADLGL